MITTSPITKGLAKFYCSKDNVSYFKCSDTETIFTPQILNQSEKVGGEILLCSSNQLTIAV